MDARPRRLCLAVALGSKRDANSYADCYSNRNADRNSYADCYSNRYAYGNSHTYCYADTYRIANSNTDAYSYPSTVAQYLYPSAGVDRR